MAGLKIPVTSDDHVLGSARALVTLVEYGDYQCPSCGAAYYIVKRLQQHFGNEVCFVFRNFPLSQVHPQAEGAAETAEFIGAHGHFWQAHDALYENQGALGIALYFEIAEQLGLSASELREALAEGVYQARVRADFSGGVRSGVNGTPTFFVNGQRHDGALDFEGLASAIDAYRQ